jgi:hypothetical protein
VQEIATQRPSGRVRAQGFERTLRMSKLGWRSQINCGVGGETTLGGVGYRIDLVGEG